MSLHADFECAAGKRIAQLGKRHWRLEAPGDASGYTKHFCVRIVLEPEEHGEVIRVDLHPDADLGEPGAAYFRSHFPSTLWMSPGAWGRWVPIRDAAGNCVTCHGDWVETHLRVDSETFLATHPPLRYSELMQWATDLQGRHPDSLRVTSLGASVEGREVPLLLIPGKGRGLPRFLVLAGQHPSEHSGCRAAQGIAEFLLSPISEAREIAAEFDFAILPMINPDGNVHGLAGANAEDIDMAEDFAGTAPTASENRLFWRWLLEDFPAEVMLDLHSGHGCASYCPPSYDGAALLVRHAEQHYTDPARLAAYRAIEDRLRFEVPSHGPPAPVLGEQFIEYQAAATWGCLPVLYHVQAAMTHPQEQFRRGLQLVRAIATALLRDARD